MRGGAAVPERANRGLWASLALLVVIPYAAPAAGLGAFEGAWVRAEREHDDATRDAEIVRVTQPMSFAVRAVARALMRRGMRPSESYEFTPGAGAPSIRNDAGEAHPIDGQRRVSADDHEMTSRFTAEDEIEQSWKHGADGSHGITTWRLEEAGRRMVVSETVHDPHFEGTIRYSTTYQRARPD